MTKVAAGKVLVVFVMVCVGHALSSGEHSAGSGLLDSYPPSLPIFKFYPPAPGEKMRWYPQGRIHEYTAKKYSDGYVVKIEERSSEESREFDRINQDVYNKVRKAAEVHRRVRRYALKEVIRPGVKLIDMCEKIENATRVYLEATTNSKKNPSAGVKAGIGFPTGCSLNSVAAHYTPNTGDDTVLQYSDVMKLDFGTHVDGYIVDSAFTWAPDPKYENLLKAVKDATLTGIREAGIDVRLCDVGEAIQEVMESYECEIDGKNYQVKCVRNLMGHSIRPYQIHAGKSVPIVAGGPETKMEEGEIYAIETFGSTGRGYVRETGECSHYALLPDIGPRRKVRLPMARDLMASIEKQFSTLPWCRRYLERAGHSRYLLSLRQLVTANVVEEYPPLCDIKGSYVAQYEHTIILRPTCKEVVSAGDPAEGDEW